MRDSEEAYHACGARAGYPRLRHLRAKQHAGDNAGRTAPPARPPWSAAARAPPAPGGPWRTRRS